MGSAIEDFNLGDKVVTTLTTSCGVCNICISGQDYICQYGLGYGHGVDGGFTEYLLVKEQNLVNVGNLDLVQSALLSCPIAVTIKALFDKASLKSHESCAVFGAGGGLGIHAAQIIQSLSGNSIAFTSSPEKIEKISKYCHLRPGPMVRKRDGTHMEHTGQAHLFGKDIIIHNYI